MAAGDVTMFEEYLLDQGNAVHNYNSHTFKLGLLNNTSPPTASDTTPAWADYSANEVDSGAGNYTLGGHPLTTVSWTEAGGIGTFYADNVVFNQHASGFTNCYWGVIFNDTAAGKNAICFVEVGTSVSEVAGKVQFLWNNDSLRKVFQYQVNP